MKQYIIVLLLIINNQLWAGNKIVFLISPPRSLSVAFLRMMESRGDFIIMNEPFISAYTLLKYDYGVVRPWLREDAPRTYEQAKRRVLDTAQKGPVFVKELGTLTTHFIDDPELIANPDIYFIFLIRNPHHTVISYYTGNQYITDNFIYHVGYQPCYQMFQAIKDSNPNAPLIILSEDLYNHPQETAEFLCNYLNIPFTQNMLHWQSLDKEFDGHKEWNELKHRGPTQYWHKNAIESNGFKQPTHYEVDRDGNPTFSEVKDEEHRKECQKAYVQNLYFYNLFLSEHGYLMEIRSM